MTCKDHTSPGACAGLAIVRIGRQLYSLFCDGGIPGPMSVANLLALMARSDMRSNVCPWYVLANGREVSCAHRIDESRELPACPSRGRFVGGVWRSA